VEKGGGRKAVAAATDSIRTHLAALVATLDADIESGAAMTARART
jgi:hypothetical protein